MEGKQVIPGAKCEAWEIDLVATAVDNGALVVVECRGGTTKQSQEDVAAFAYRISDVGAGRGFLVTEVDPQRGAKQLADAESIRRVVIKPASTVDEHVVVLDFLKTVLVSVSDSVTVVDAVQIEMS